LPAKPRLGISACLLGQKVRYDGGDKRDRFMVETFGLHVDWIPVCPEAEVGMGVPREPVRLIGDPAAPRMIAASSGKDWALAMNHYARRRARALTQLDLSGYVFKKDSPSCGMERVRIYGKSGAPSRLGRGLFAASLMGHLPLLPVEEEGRLNDPGLRKNFVERVFAYQRWQQAIHGQKSPAALVEFHTRHKLLLLAHSPSHCPRLGRIVADAKKTTIRFVYEDYGRLFMEALAVRATTKKHSNVLEHMIGYFSKQLSAEERRELVALLADFRRQMVPLIVPLTLILHYVKKYQVQRLTNQIYLAPSPKELMLRNHI
jgi:uncharacterized protein YbgA (DUF1722 family)/uncharacterized protein YbbK (DUF523 family)